VNDFYSFYLLVILSEPTDFRALGNFLAVRKKNLFLIIQLKFLVIQLKLLGEESTVLF